MACCYRVLIGKLNRALCLHVLTTENSCTNYVAFLFGHSIFWHIYCFVMPPQAGALSNDAICLSVAYIGPKSRTERPRETKIGTEVAHITHDSDTTFKFKRSRSQGHCGGLPHS